MTIVETMDFVGREVGPCKHTNANLATLPDPIPASMRLRVSRDKPRASRIVELDSPRCFVGSASNCQVQIQEPGVAPVECLIIQGTKHHVVRWLIASQPLGGGELFEDEAVYAGDPLQIGPVELELLVDEIMSAEDSPPPEPLVQVEHTPAADEDRLAEYVLRLEQLESQLVELQQTIKLAATGAIADVEASRQRSDELAASLSDLAGRLTDFQSRGTSERERWSREMADLEGALRSRLNDFVGLQEFVALQEEVQRLRDEVLAVRREFGDLAAKEDSRECVAELSRKLTEQTAAIQQQQATWEGARQQLERQLQLHGEQFEQVEARLARQSDCQTGNDAAREAADARADRLQQAVDELSERVATQQEDYAAVRTDWNRDRALWESELAEAQQQLARFAAAETAGREFREAWARERDELKHQVAQALSRTEEIQDQLDAQRQLWTQPLQGQTRLASDDVAVDHPEGTAGQQLKRLASIAPKNPLDQVLAGYSAMDPGEHEQEDADAPPSGDEPARRPSGAAEMLTTEPDDLDTESGYPGAVDVASTYYEQTFNGLCSTLETDDPAEDDDSFEPPLLATTELRSYCDTPASGDACTAQAEEVAFEVESSAPPVSTSEVLARLGHAVSWYDEGPDDAYRNADSGSEDDAFQSQHAARQAVAHQDQQFHDRTHHDTTSAPMTAAPSNSADDEEESIEAYMTRLMNRVRGGDARDEPYRQAAPTVERSPVVEYTEVAKAPTPETAPPVEKFDPEAYKPRSQAPEAADRLTAMRSLANDSARTAIASHAKRSWSNIVKQKLLVSMLTFFAAIPLLIAFWGDPVVMGIGSMLVGGVLLYWIHNAVTYRRLLLESLMLETERVDSQEATPDEEESTGRENIA